MKKAGMRLKDWCLDGCCGNRRHSEALSRSVEKGKGESRETKDWGKEHGGWERLNKEAARGTRQHDSGARRQILLRSSEVMSG